MKSPIIKAFLLATLAGALPAQAQVAPPAATPPAAAAAPPAAMAVTPSYQFAPGDVISVNLVNMPSQSTPQTMVAPDGTVSLNLIHEVTVAGLTTAQVTTLLTKKWKYYFVNPVVTVSLVQKHPQFVVFSGYLNHPGTLDYHPGMHLLEALAESGGALTTADPVNSVITHADGSKQTLDLSHPETKPNTPVDMPLAPGDVVYVPEQLEKVSVVGQVKQPGSLPYNDHLTVLEAITESGGIVDMKRANLKEARLTHNSVDRPLNLDAMLNKGDMTDNINLAPGDRLTIPESNNRVYVYGDVGHPSWYYYQEGDRIQDALSDAAIAPDADTGKINLLHVNKDKTEAQLVHVNLNDFQLRGDIKGNPLIQPGDSLYIPRQHQSFKLADIFAPLQAIGSVSYTTRLLQNR